MIINSTKEFKDVCKTILLAIDTSEQSLISETLELVSGDGSLSLSVTNREYFVSVKLPQSDSSFKATVNALLFLKLVSQLTTDTLELIVDDKSLIIKADGTYTLPLIFKDNELLELPKINLGNITTTMSISPSILNSILVYNSKELQSAKVVYKPVQKMYYVDEKGAITFTSGACVNNFELEKPIKLLLSGKVVKLFKLFDNANKVDFAISQEESSNGSVLTNIRFSTDNISITATTPSDTSLLESVPVDAIRNMSNKNYEYSVLFNREHLVKLLSRLLLFKDDISVVADFKFNETGCTIEYNHNEETIGYNDEQVNSFEYGLHLNIETLKNILDGCQEEYITLNFGDHKAVVVVRQNIKNIIPEWTL